MIRRKKKKSNHQQITRTEVMQPELRTPEAEVRSELCAGKARDSCSREYQRKVAKRVNERKIQISKVIEKKYGGFVRMHAL